MSQSTTSPKLGPIARIKNYLERDQWVPDLEALPFYRALPLKITRVVWLTAHSFTQDNCLFRASALTYVTVLSLVPLLAVSFSAAKSLGFLDALRVETIDPFLAETFGPSEAELEAQAASIPPEISSTGEEVEVVMEGPATEAMASSEGARELRKTLDSLLDFVQDTDFTGLSAVGLLLLLYAVLRLLGTIEKSLNLIWGVHQARTLVRKIADYLTIVIATPLLLVLAFGVTAKSEAILVGLDQWLGFYKDGEEAGLGFASLVALAVRFAPLLASWIGFAFVYMVIPNTRTKLFSAILGGVLAGSLWHVAQLAFKGGLIKVADYNAIYVGFASFPILMVWIYISWVTVFLGAELAAAHQGEPAYRQIARSHPTDHAFKEVVALRLITRVARAFLDGEPPKTASKLAGELRLPIRSCTGVIESLVEHEVLARTDESGEPGVLPARSLDRITVKSVLDALKGTAGTVEVPSDSWLDQHLDGLLESLQAEMEQSESNCTLLELAKRTELVEPEQEQENGSPPSGNEPS